MDHATNPRFPWKDPISIGAREVTAEEVIEVLDARLTRRRKHRIDQAVAARTYDVSCVFDGPYDMGNVSAVLRTCEGLGIQPVHIVESEDDFKEANRVTQGAQKWLDIRRWQQPARCAAALGEQGYRICATHLEASRPIAEVDFSEPTAVVVGNEADGVSEAMLAAADVRCVIPMAGFTQSFNISVAAAVALYHVRQWRADHLGADVQMSAAEQRIARAHFYMRGVDQAKRYLRELLARRD